MASTKIHTYFEASPGHPIIGEFMKSWQRMGWEVVVLCKGDTYGTPYSLFDFNSKVAEYPTVNDPNYELICYRRWLAFCDRASMGQGIFFADYDTLNLSLAPLDPPPQSTLYMARAVGFGYIHPTSADRIIETLVSAPITPPHMSDMTILTASGIFVLGEPYVHNVPTDTKLVHFHGQAKVIFGP